MAQRTGQSLPRSLKLYIAGVVALSAFALVAATLVFPADKHIALRLGPPETSVSALEIALGVGFWTILP